MTDLTHITRELREAAEKATPGPWFDGQADQHEQPIVRNQHIEVATCWHHCVAAILEEAKANAALIALLRNHIIPILDALDAAPRMRDCMPKGSPGLLVTQEHFDGLVKQCDELCAFVNDVTALLGWDAPRPLKETLEALNAANARVRELEAKLEFIGYAEMSFGLSTMTPEEIHAWMEGERAHLTKMKD